MFILRENDADNALQSGAEKLVPDRPVGEQIEGRRRVAIEGVTPEIDCGRFPIKRIVGDTVRVEANVFADGHDQVACRLLYWQDPKNPLTSPMVALPNDRWRGEFFVAKLGRYQYTIEGWIDHFQTWRSALVKRVAAQQDVHVELLVGVDLLEEAATRSER
jgi:starch synthase (maltosyl-transferring)